MYPWISCTLDFWLQFFEKMCGLYMDVYGNCNIFGLTDTVALFAKEAGFYRFWVFFQASSLQNEVSDPPFFFYISDISNSSSFNGKISRKKSMLEKFGMNVLNKNLVFVAGYVLQP